MKRIRIRILGNHKSVGNRYEIKANLQTYQGIKACLQGAAAWHPPPVRPHRWPPKHPSMTKENMSTLLSAKKICKSCSWSSSSLQVLKKSLFRCNRSCLSICLCIALNAMGVSAWPPGLNSRCRVGSSEPCGTQRHRCVAWRSFLKKSRSTKTRFRRLAE